MLREQTIQVLIDAASELADLLELPGDYPDEFFQATVPVHAIILAHQALWMVEDDRANGL